MVYIWEEKKKYGEGRLSFFPVTELVECHCRVAISSEGAV